MSESYYFLKDYKNSLNYLNRAINLRPSKLNLRLRRAETLHKRVNNYKKALTHYKQIKVLLKQKKLKGKIPFNLNKKISEVQALIPKKNSPSRSLSSLKKEGSSK